MISIINDFSDNAYVDYALKFADSAFLLFLFRSRSEITFTFARQIVKLISLQLLCYVNHPQIAIAMQYPQNADFLKKSCQIHERRPSIILRKTILFFISFAVILAFISQP